MCGRGAGKPHMLRWHLSLASELWVMETSITQRVIKHSQRPLRKGSSHFQGDQRHQREGEPGKDNTKQCCSCGETKKTTQLSGQAGGQGTECCLRVATASTGRRALQRQQLCGSERGARLTSYKQADSAGWVQVGAGVAAAGWGLICGRVGDILSLLIILWILCVLNNTFGWHEQRKLAMREIDLSGGQEGSANVVWSLRNRWRTIEMADNAQRQMVSSLQTKPGSNTEQISRKYKAHDKAAMMTVVSSSTSREVQQCSFILLTQYAKKPVVWISRGSYHPTAELTCPLLFIATENP